MLVTAVALLVVGASVLLLLSYRPHRAHLRRSLVRQAEAQVPAEQEAALETRLARRARSAAAGTLVTGIVALVLNQTWDGADEVSGGFLFVSVLVVAGAAGAALADVLWPGTVSDGPRTARASAPTVADYLPAEIRGLSRVFVGAGVVTLAGTLLLTRTEWFDLGTVLRSPVPVLAVGLPVLLLLTAVATRRVLDAPQPARDEAELYWQDAVRAQTLSSLSVAAPLVSLLALVVCGSVLDDAASAAASGGAGGAV